MKNLFLTSG